MNSAELIKALRYCAEHEGCDYYIAKDCPIEDTWVCGVDCEQILMRDAAAELKAADKRIAELEAQMPKEGEWIKHGCEEDQFSYCECPFCGFIGLEYHYCPNCGSRMRKGESNGES